MSLLENPLDDYLSDRWVIYDGDKWYFKEEMTFGGPQGSRVGPLIWNVMYDDFLRTDLPAGTSIIGFANDALVVCVTDRSRLPKPFNVEPLCLGLCPILVAPGKPREGWWRTW